MWCPKCKLEYRDGIEECAYCHIPLVDELIEEESEEAVPPHFEGLDAVDVSEDISYAASMRYRTVEEKAEDAKSSGVTLLAVGVMGLAGVALCAAGFLPVKFSGIGAVISYTTMISLFLLFTIVGIRSLYRLPSLRSEAEREREKISDIKKWFLDNHSKDAIDASVGGAVVYDRYYARVQYMKDRINEHFMELEPAFLDYIIEDLYHTMFEM